MKDRTTSVEQFLETAAGKTPTPGGGAVAAMCGALGAAMGEMTLNYSVDKKDLQVYAGELRPALKEMTRARALLLRLMEEDQLAYEAMTAARKLPESDPTRRQQMQAAQETGIAVPQAIGAAALAVLDLTDRVVNFVNPYLLSDLAVCADLAMAALRCATYNVRVNLRDMAADDQRRRLESWINQSLTRGSELVQQASGRILARMDSQGG